MGKTNLKEKRFSPVYKAMKLIRITYITIELFKDTETK